MAVVATPAPVVPLAASAEDLFSAEEEEVSLPASKRRCRDGEEGEAGSVGAETEVPAPPSKKRCRDGEAGDAKAEEEVEVGAAGGDDISALIAASAASKAEADREAKAGPPIWEFGVSKGHEVYPEECQAPIEEQYEKYMLGKDDDSKLGKIVSRGHSIVLDFENKQQYVEGFAGRKRSLRRRTLTALWKFSVKGGFKAFDAPLQEKVESAYQQSLKDGPKEVEIVVANDGKTRTVAIVDFKAMTQRIKGSSTGRPPRALERTAFETTDPALS